MFKLRINKIVLDLHSAWQRRNQVGEFEGIIISDPGKDHANFLSVIQAALLLIKKTDPRRLELVKRHIRLVWNVKLWPAGAQYTHHNQTCTIDFKHLVQHGDKEWWIGACACILIHEATHGRIHSRGIGYTPELRKRIERLCVCEENRFVFRLTLTKPTLADSLHQKFDPSKWERSWNTTPMEQIKELLKWW